MKTAKNLFVISLLLVLSGTIQAKKPVKALIITGQSIHNWEVSSLLLQKYLNESGLFTADIAVSPPKGTDMSKFRPDFSAYKVVILDYTGDAWADDVNKNFLDYVQKGGGLVVYHEADNGFPEWKEFNEIIGLGGWGDRNEKDGPYVYWKDGKIVRDDTPGKCGSHGKQHEYAIDTRAKDHPVMKGLPATWMHAKDELYDRLRGPARNLTVLATAYSDEQTGGSGRNEPVLMTVTRGKGRIFHTVLGHVGRKDAEHPAIECKDFIVTFLRGTEWAATGKVTQKVPNDFPNKLN